MLNKRAAVKESTARRVLEAARRLGFTLEQPHYRLAAGKAPVTIRMGFILLQEATPLLPAVGPGADARGCPMATGGPGAGDTAFCHRCGGKRWLRAIHRLSGDEVEVLGLVALDHR